MTSRTQTRMVPETFTENTMPYASEQVDVSSPVVHGVPQNSSG